MKSKLISIGDEILIGQVVNTNAAYLGEKLFSIGIPVEKAVIIGDEEDILLEELDESMKNYDVTIITGGLGPTHDDITKPILIRYFNDELILNEEVLKHVKNFFSSREIKMPVSNEAQALVPKNSEVIWNENGTAPGIFIEKENKIFIALPGVPYEMKVMVEKMILPKLSDRFKTSIDYVIKQKTLLTTGLGESSLNERLGDLKEIIGDSKLAFLPSAEGVRLRINVKASSEEEAKKKLQEIENKITGKVKDYIFGFDDDTMEQVVGKILKDRNLTLSIAESCTGGMVSLRIVNIPGSSEYYMGGVCSYSNKEKMRILEVKKETLEKFGAVSEETAKEMAYGIRKKMDTDIGISTTGIAGPAGGTKEKPVGLVWIGFSNKEKTYAKKFLFGNNRERNMLRATQRALEILRRELLNIEIKF